MCSAQPKPTHSGRWNIDLKNINEAEARKLMSAEHKALGYRPPPGSLAAEAQSIASKHPDVHSGLSEEQLKQAAKEDADRIKSERSANGVDLGAAVSEGEARKLMSEEHKALGYRPPSGSLAAEAQSAAAKRPGSSAQDPPGLLHIHRAALEDASRVSGGNATNIDVNAIGEVEARKLMSEEHKVLGYRPPPGSLAAEAQSAAAKHPNAHAGVDPSTLSKAAFEDAKKIEAQRQAALCTVENQVSEESAGSSNEQKVAGRVPAKAEIWPPLVRA